MKKILLVVAALALVFSGVNAADLGGDALALKATVSGEASVTFGVNLDDANLGVDGVQYATGIKNATDVGLVLTVISERSQSDKGEGEVYAEIALKEIKAVADGASATLTNHVALDYAKIYVGPVVVSMTDGDAKIDKAGVVTTKLTYTTLANDQNGTGSLWVSLKDTSVVAVDIGVESKLSYVDGTVNKDNIYNIFGSVGLNAIENLSVVVAANGSIQPFTTAGVGVDVSYTLKNLAGEGFNLKPMVSADLTFVPVALANNDGDDVSKADMNMEIAGGFNFSVPGNQVSDADNFGLTDIDYDTGITLKVAYLNSGVSYWNPVEEAIENFYVNGMAIGAKFNVGTMVEGLTLYGYVDAVTPVSYVYSNADIQESFVDTFADDLAKNNSTSLSYGLRTSYKIDTVTPYAEIWAVDNGKSQTFTGAALSAVTKNNGVEDLYVKAGVDIAAFKLTTISIAYTSDDLANVFTSGINADTNSAATGKNGVLEFTAKVAL